jgi:hypothetical protein
MKQLNKLKNNYKVNIIFEIWVFVEDYSKGFGSMFKVDFKKVMDQ